MDPQAPPVVAVVVARDPGPWFDEALGSLAAQDYPNLSVLVIDAGSTEDPTPRVAEVLPGAYVRRLGAPVGYAAAANEALTVVEGAAFYLMCHDDVAPDPDAVRILVEEAFRSNAGVVSPKLVSWDDPSRLLQVGMSADRSGVPVALAQAGELDQEQHDSVLDVFVAPGGLMLVRADLFATLGGFDDGMVLFGEDVDLSWRAQVAGARVIVAPSARARHRVALAGGLRSLPELPGIPAERRPGGARLDLQRRHELRAALKAYSFWRLMRVLPVLALHTLGEVLVGLAGGHPEEARAAIHAWTWNLGRTGDLRTRRRELAKHRALPDSEIRRLQTTGSTRLVALVQGAFTRASDLSQLPYIPHLPHLVDPVPLDADAETLDIPVRMPAAVWVPPALLMLAVGAFLFGSRSILTSGLPAVGQFAPFPGVGRLLGAYASSTRPTGVGQLAPAPLALALAGLLTGLLLDSPGMAQTVLVIGMLPVGALGAYWVSRRLGSRWARLVAPAVYLALPLPYDAVAHARWASLVAYGAAPWVIGLFLRSTGLEPFAPESGGPGPGRRWRLWLAGGLVLAGAGAVAPGVVVAVLIGGVGCLAGSLVTSRHVARGVASLVLMAAAGWLLAFPWSAGLVGAGGQAAAVFGVPEAVFRATGIGTLLGSHVVPGGTNWVGWVLLPGAALPLLMGRDWRLAWGLRLWGMALASWAAAWGAGRGWFGVALPEPGVLLAVAGTALALSAALGVVAFERDLAGFGLGWRQAAAVLGVAGLVTASVGAIGHIGTGRWGAPTADLRTSVAALPGRAAGGRVLWLGDPAAVPSGGWQIERGVGYSTSTAAVPDLTYQWPPPDPGALVAVVPALEAAASGTTVEVGRQLAGLGIRYVVIPLAEAPGGRALPPPPRLVAGLEDQTDLRPLQLGPGVTAFENVDWRPGSGPPPASPSGLARGAAVGLEGLLWLAATGALLATRRRRRRTDAHDPQTEFAVSSPEGPRAEAGP